MKSIGLHVNEETKVEDGDNMQHVSPDSDTRPATPLSNHSSMMDMEERLQLMQNDINLLKQRNYEKKSLSFMRLRSLKKRL